MHRPVRAATGQRGAALPLVLWLVVLMVATVGAFALSSRVEMLQGKTQADGARAQEVARAGIEYAMARLVDPRTGRRWAADGRPYRWSFDGAEVELRILDESGKVDINQADPALLAALLRTLGAEPSAAQQLAGAIADWRDPDSLLQPGGGAEDPAYAAAGRAHGAKDAPFESVSELHQVLGMAPELFARLAPHLTVYSGLSRPNAQFAPAPVLASMGLDATRAGPQHRSGEPVADTGTYSIESRAKLADGREAVLRATLRSGGGVVPGAAYVVMRWESGALAR